MRALSGSSEGLPSKSNGVSLNILTDKFAVISFVIINVFKCELRALSGCPLNQAGNFYGPSSFPKLIVSIEDLNLAQVDQIGSQSAIELVSLVD